MARSKKRLKRPSKAPRPERKPSTPPATREVRKTDSSKPLAREARKSTPPVTREARKTAESAPLAREGRKSTPPATQATRKSGELPVVREARKSTPPPTREPSRTVSPPVGRELRSTSGEIAPLAREARKSTPPPMGEARKTAESVPLIWEPRKSGRSAPFERDAAATTHGRTRELPRLRGNLPPPPPPRRSKSATVHLLDLDDAVISEQLVEPLRGAALVDQVIAKLAAAGGRLGGGGLPEHPASGIAIGELNALRMPGGRLLPPSLHRFLAYDETHLGIVEGQPAKLRFVSFRDLLEKTVPRAIAARYAGADLLVGGRCLRLLDRGSACFFMYVGHPDSHGEYPVFQLDGSNVHLAYPGVDVYLADDHLDASAHGRYTAAIEDQAHRNFRGMVSFRLPRI